jgi:hypothetical protein
VTAEYVFAPAGGGPDLDVVISSPKTGKIDFPIGFAMPPKKSKTFHTTSPGTPHLIKRKIMIKKLK